MKQKIFLFIFSLALSTSAFAGERPKRVYADIVGDLFHTGHVEFIKKAKAEGDYLIIGVLSDEDVESYKRIPIMTMEERAEVISTCQYVDEVILAPPLQVTKKWLKKHKIDLVVHGDDCDEKMLSEQYGAPIKMKIFKIVPYTCGVSTTNIIERISNRIKENDVNKK